MTENSSWLEPLSVHRSKLLRGALLNCSFGVMCSHILLIPCRSVSSVSRLFRKRHQRKL